MNQIEFVQSLIGLPYVDRANGPSEFDCWGLFRYVQKNLFSRDLETIISDTMNIREIAYLFKNHEERKKWRVCEKPTHGGAVEMSHSRHPHHIGIWLDIDGGAILHCQPSAGVSFDPVLALKAGGWRRFIYHEWVG